MQLALTAIDHSQVKVPFTPAGTPESRIIDIPVA